MKTSCIFIVSLVLVALCSLARSEWSQGPDKCCFSFSNAIIPVKQVESYHTTHLQCNMNGVIFITKAPREICTNPTEKWVQRLMKLVDKQNMKQMTEGGSGDSCTDQTLPNEHWSAIDKANSASRSDHRLTTNTTMRTSCIFIACLVLVACCSVDASDWSQRPDKCCFSFSNARIPVKQVESYHTTTILCSVNGVIFITKAQREICTNPTEKWVQRLMKLVDAQNMKQMTEAGSGDSA
ncbi:uncharacterized protein LOC130247392 [Danio aesculapii]|uniref:uncharacterized protein LOC130247392 n=1 Tax=Danio aesculapii TaxID=1142201 RepID=UPI0024BFCC9B|nr:uncharacterized protein LOC130247392 [Danio aesculapii]